jgi:ferredoxin
VKQKPDPEILPSDQQLALVPQTSGNTINGLGEKSFRRPTPVYWRDPDSITHGELQKYFIDRSDSCPGLHDVRNDPTRKPQAPDPIAGKQATGTAAEWTARVKAHALANEGDAVAITRFNPDWVFDDTELDADWLIVFAVEMDYDNLAQAPSTLDNPTSAVEVIRQYNRVARTVFSVSNWIRRQGYWAKPHPGPMAGDLTMIPAAIEAGIGQLAKHGSMISPIFGANFRLGAVSTKMPLTADAPIDIGVDEFCVSCQLCVNECPPDALSHDKQKVRGAEKWYVDFDKCIPYFNETYGCAICLVVCPWSRPGVARRLVDKLARRRKSPA